MVPYRRPVSHCHGPFWLLLAGVNIKQESTTFETCAGSMPVSPPNHNPSVLAESSGMFFIKGSFLRQIAKGRWSLFDMPSLSGRTEDRDHRHRRSNVANADPRRTRSAKVIAIADFRASYHRPYADAATPKFHNGRPDSIKQKSDAVRPEQSSMPFHSLA